MSKRKAIVISVVIVAIAIAGMVVWRVNKNRPVAKPIINHEAYKPTQTSIVNRLPVEKKKSSYKEEYWQPKPIGLAEGKKYIGKVIIHAKWGKGPGEFGLQNVEGPYQEGPGVLTIRANIIYIFDYYNHRVLKYSTEGNYVGAIVLEKGINIPPALRNTNYPGVCYLFEKDKKIGFNPRGPFRAKVYKSFPPNKCIAPLVGAEIGIDNNKNILLTAQNRASSADVILKYNKDGKFISKIFDTEELPDEEKKKLRSHGYLGGLLIDDLDNVYLNNAFCSATNRKNILKNCEGIVVKISESNNNKVEILQWADLDNKTKVFLKPIFIPDLETSIINQALKKLIECSRSELLSLFSVNVGNPVRIATDKKGNIYEIVICESDYQWKEGVMVIEWRLVKWRPVK